MFTATTTRTAGGATFSELDDEDFWFAGLLATVRGNKRFTRESIYVALMQMPQKARDELRSLFLQTFDHLMRGR